MFFGGRPRYHPFDQSAASSLIHARSVESPGHPDAAGAAAAGLVELVGAPLRVDGDASAGLLLQSSKFEKLGNLGVRSINYIVLPFLYTVVSGKRKRSRSTNITFHSFSAMLVEHEKKHCHGQLHLKQRLLKPELIKK